ncbi:hypothetical protein BT93_A2124 [Corymbia citriodora subsp. variegata]|nr:hypothetical protein BT93_A2124 [Corymbia citriodora subsp. variegata]
MASSAAAVALATPFSRSPPPPRRFPHRLVVPSPSDARSTFVAPGQARTSPFSSVVSPPTMPNTSLRSLNRRWKVRSLIRQPLISADDQWGMWTALFATGAFGLWSEKTKIGSMVSAALVSTLIGLTASNVGIIPCEAPAYSTVLEFLLPLTIPLLLFRADLRRVFRSTGKLLLAFLLGLAVNYVAISEALSISPSVVAAGVAADNVICAVYFLILFALASKVPPETSKSPSDVSVSLKLDSGGKIPILQTATAVATAFAICKIGTYITKLSGIQGGGLPIITALVVILATILPAQFGSLAHSGDAISLVLMQVMD